MLNILRSEARSPNKKLVEVPRKAGEDNLAWLVRNLPKKKNDTNIVLLGGQSTCAFRLRVAQSHARHDLSPSHWSHALLLGPVQNGRFASTEVYEISLEPPQGFGFPPTSNAVQTGSIEQYGDPENYPNLALISLPVSFNEVKNVLVRFQEQRAVLDALELLILWLSFVWGVGRTGNPLLDGHGIPSAAMIEVVVGGAGFEITPGLASRSSCPEAIWQAAKWWYEHFEREKRPSPYGAWWVTHKL